MIPLSMQQKTAYTEPKSGVTYYFVPVTGELELEHMELCVGLDNEVKAEKAKGNENPDEFTMRIEWTKRAMAFFDKVLVGWAGLPKPYPEDKKPSQLFSAQDRGEILGYWFLAGTLTDEQKKTLL